jgi:multidrug efflux pump subunit AcrA (membrane-fusion protein)
MLEPHGPGIDIALDLPGFDDDTDADDEFQVQSLSGSDGTGGTGQPWWRRRRWVVAIGVALALLLLVGLVATALAVRRPRITYHYAQVKEGMLALTASATGPVQGTIYSVNFTGSGKLAEIDVTVGQAVTAGQALAKLDPTSLEDAVNQAQAAVDAAQTAVNDATTNQGAVNTQTSANLQTAYDQEQAALAKCGSSSSCQQQAQDQYAQAQAEAQTQNDQAQAQVNAAQSQLTSAQAQLTTAQDNASNTTLTAPHAGTIAVVNGLVGGTPGAASAATASAGGTSASGGGNTFIQIADLSALQVEADVNEADIGGVTPGNAAQFTVSAYPGVVFAGTVSAIAPLGQTVANVVTYPVTITVNMQALQGAHLLPGMTATSSIITIQRTGVLLIPVGAVSVARTATNPANGFFTSAQVRAATAQAQQALTEIQSLDPNSGQDTPTTAFVVEQVKGKLVLKPVVIGLSNGSVYELLTGLSLGDTIVSGATGGPFSATASGGAGPGLRFGGRLGGGG